MTHAKAQRIRFGILAARHALERDRLTPWQVDYLEGCEASGCLIKDSQRAYDRECLRIEEPAMWEELDRRRGQS